MQNIGTPMQCPELNLSPDKAGAIELSDNMQQTLSLLTAFWHNQRVVLKGSPTGVLFTASPQLEDIIHAVGSGADDNYQGPDKQVTEVMVMGHPDNTGDIWVRPKKIATVANAWPLAAKEAMGFSVTNLNMLHALIKVDGEKLIIAYTI